LSINLCNLAIAKRLSERGKPLKEVSKGGHQQNDE
jgi:hypothetical protein